MPGSMPATSQLDWLSSTTAMIVVFWSRATRDLLKSFGWGIAALHRLHAATKLPSPRRPPHRISWSHFRLETLLSIPYSTPRTVHHLKIHWFRPRGRPAVRIPFAPPVGRLE